MTGDRCGNRRAAAAIGDMHQIEPERDFELLAQEMRGRAQSRRGEAELAGVGPDVIDELADALRRYRRVNRESGREADRQCDWIEVLVRIVRDVSEQRRIDYEIIDGDEERVAVGRGFRGLSSANIAARARDVLDIELPAETLRQFLRD